MIAYEGKVIGPRAIVRLIAEMWQRLSVSKVSSLC